MNGEADRTEATDAAEPLPGRPRMWTVFVAVAVALVVIVLVQAVLVGAYIGWRVTGGMDLDDVVKGLEAELSRPALFVTLGICSQLVVGMTALVAARLSATPMGARLAMGRPRLPGWGYPVIAIGAWLPLAAGVSLAILIARVIPPDKTAELLYAQMTRSWAIPFILFIALAPGFMEELLFRGYVQTRLLQRWRPWLAILVASIIFALFHITPHAIASVFVIGLWLGVIAWRTGSVWPGVLCHATMNGGWNIWQVGHRVWGFPEKPPLVMAIGCGSLIFVCFLVSAWILWKKGGCEGELQVGAS